MFKRLNFIIMALIAVGFVLPVTGTAKKAESSVKTMKISKKTSKKAKSAKKTKKVKDGKLSVTPKVGKLTSRLTFNKKFKQTKLKDILSRGKKTKVKDCSGKKGRAVILYHYMGDSYLTSLAQDTVKFAPIFESYDYKVLVKFPVGIGPKDKKWNLSAKAFKEADKRYDPTASNFIKAIKHAISKGYTVDIFLLSHGLEQSGYGSFVVSEGTFDKSTLMSMRDVERALSYKETGCKKLPLRMVYHMACYGSSFAQSWRKLGAQVSIGTRFINFYPM
jgi:hypothetical protein